LRWQDNRQVEEIKETSKPLHQKKFS